MATQHTCGTRQPPPCHGCMAVGAQERFVRQWRESNPVEVWGAPYLCPLCNKAVQDFYALPAHTAQIESHQQGHGDDWTAYRAALDGDDAAGGDGVDARP